MSTWNGILRIIEIQHRNSQGNILWEAKNIYNILHQDGEEFILRAAFAGGQISTIIPEDYYLGLDNRQAVVAADTMDDLIGEPSVTRGYARQAVGSSGDFTLNFQSDHYVATSPIVAFRADDTWGPVSNLFITDQADNTGYLIATAILPSALSVSAGESVTMRIGLQLRAC